VSKQQKQYFTVHFHKVGLSLSAQYIVISKAVHYTYHNADKCSFTSGIFPSIKCQKY